MAPFLSLGGRGGGGGIARGVSNSNRLNALNDADPPQPMTTEDGDIEMNSSIKHSKFYNGATPWSPPQNADAAIFHEPAKQAESPLVRSFTGTLEIGVSIRSSVDININALLKLFLPYALNIDTDFRILPLQGGNQIISYPNGDPTTKEGIDLYFQHKTVKDGVRGKITVTMSKLISQMKDMGSVFRTYLNKEKVYVIQAALGLVDARIIGVFLQPNPILTF
jgi:hypothetical protein